jgi:hypothetical protein
VLLAGLVVEQRAVLREIATSARSIGPPLRVLAAISSMLSAMRASPFA